MDSGERTWGVMGAVLLAAVAVLTAIRVADEESTAYALGAALGTVVAALVIAALLRWAYVRVSGGGEVRSPWLWLIAALVAIAGAIGQAAPDEDADAEARSALGPGDGRPALVLSRPPF